MWFSSTCTNMGQKADGAVLFVNQFGHQNAPSHGNLRALYHGQRILSKWFRPPPRNDIYLSNYLDFLMVYV